MSLCESSNHTYAILDFYAEHISTVKNGNRIVGALGSCLDGLLCKQSKRKCRIISKDYLGDNVNGTYTGILQMLKSKEIDLYLKGETESSAIDEPWLKKSSPFKSSGLFLGHRIFKSNDDAEYFDLSYNLYLGFEITFLYFFTLFVSVLFLFFYTKLSNKLNRKKIKLKLIFAYHFLNDNVLKLSGLGLFLYSFNLFLNLSQIMLTSNINVNKIVVDTSELLKNDYDILNTEKVACLVKQEIEINKKTKFSKNSIYYQLVNDKMYFKERHSYERYLFKGKDRCLIENGSPLLKMVESRNFFVGSQIFELSLYFVYGMIGLNYEGWKLQKPILSFNEVIYYSLKNSNNKEFVQKISTNLLEKGLSVKLDNCMETNTLLSTQKTIKIFKNLDDYLNENANFSNLELKNFRFLMIAYFSICFFILFIWCIDKFRCKLKFSN